MARPKLKVLQPRIQPLSGRLTQLTGNPAATPRLRGRAGVERRERYLRLHPLCVECTKGGQTGAATVPDHKIPLWAGGADDLDINGNPLCSHHHGTKTACEARMRAAGGWLSTPCICGQHGQASRTA